MRDQFIATLCEIVEEHPETMLITGDLGFGVFNDFRERFAPNFLNVGVAEQNMTMVATGMALEGWNCFTYSIGNFPTLRCLEQIRNDAAYHDCNVKVVAVGGGFSYGALGISHHATEDLAILRSIPNLSVFAPGGEWETERATRYIAENDGCFYLRLDKDMGDDAPGDARDEFVPGRPRKLRDGKDLIVFSAGGILSESQKAAEVLSQEHGIEAAVYSVHTLKPFDRPFIASLLSKTPVAITLEEHVLNGGLGSALSELLVDQGLTGVRMKRMGLKDQFSSIVGDQEYLRKAYGLDADAVVRMAVDLLG